MALQEDQKKEIKQPAGGVSGEAEEQVGEDTREGITDSQERPGALPGEATVLSLSKPKKKVQFASDLETTPSKCSRQTEIETKGNGQRMEKEARIIEEERAVQGKVCGECSQRDTSSGECSQVHEPISERNQSAMQGGMLLTPEKKAKQHTEVVGKGIEIPVEPKRRFSSPESSSSSSTSVGINTVNLSNSPLLREGGTAGIGTSKRSFRIFTRCFKASARDDLDIVVDTTINRTSRRGYSAVQRRSSYTLPVLGTPGYNARLKSVLCVPEQVKAAEKQLRKLQERWAVEKASKATSIREGSLTNADVVWKWKSNEVCAWLESIGLERYAPMFLVNGVDGSTLLELSRSQFNYGLDVNDEDHLTSLQVGVLAFLTGKLPKFKRTSELVYVDEWSLENTLLWLRKRGFHVLSDRFLDRAIHGTVFLAVDADYFIDEIVHLEQVTQSFVARLSLKLSILHARRSQQNPYVSVVNQELEEDPGPKDVSEWDGKEVEAWLRSVNVGHKVGLFATHCINGITLLHLSYEMLREMGMSEILSIVLIKALNKLRIEHRSLWKRRRGKEREKNRRNTNLVRVEKPVSRSSSTTDSSEGQQSDVFTANVEKYRYLLEKMTLVSGVAVNSSTAGKVAEASVTSS